MTGDRLRLQVDEGVARLTLTRPEGGNGVDLQFVEECSDAVDALSNDPTVRALLIDAEGRNFTVGGDLKFIGRDLDRVADLVDSMLAQWHDRVLPRFDALPFPIVAAVQGSAAGGGLGLVWCADIVVAADDLKIVTGFDKVGLSGDGGSSWHLPRLAGLRRAQQILIGGETVPAEQALAWGLVTQVVPLADLAAAATAVTARLAAGPTAALGRMRDLLWHSGERSHAEQLAAERRAMKSCLLEPDGREGISAFLERRTPEFIGAPPAGPA